MPLENGRNVGGRPPRSSREAVVDVALELVRTDGLGGVTLAAVGQRLGLGKVAMYTYVASKDDLLLAMRDEVNRRQLAALQEERDLPPDAALKAMCGRLVATMTDYGQLMAVVEPDVTGPGLEIAERFLELLEQLGLEPSQQLQVWALLGSFVSSFVTRGQPVLAGSLSAGGEVRYPRASSMLHEAETVHGSAFVDDVVLMVIDVLIPALRRH